MADLPGATGLDPGPGETEQDGLQIVLFRAGGTLFAIPASDVEQARHGSDDIELTVDLAAEVHSGACGDLLLVIVTGGERLGLRVDEVLEVTTLPLTDIYALPRPAAKQQRGGYVSGVARCDDELAVLLDPDALARVAEARAMAATIAPPRQ
jgi:chemotaxis signal transduction protein